MTTEPIPDLDNDEEYYRESLSLQSQQVANLLARVAELERSIAVVNSYLADDVASVVRVHDENARLRELLQESMKHFYADCIGDEMKDKIRKELNQ